MERGYRDDQDFFINVMVAAVALGVACASLSHRLLRSVFSLRTEVRR